MYIARRFLFKFAYSKLTLLKSEKKTDNIASIKLTSGTDNKNKGYC